jgi:hypothetical protein
MALIAKGFAVTEFPPWGGPGGSPFHEVCPAGQFVVGAHWQSGDWLDQISITCAPVDATGLTGPQWHGSTFGGNGGSADEKSCPPASVIRSGMIGRHPTEHYARFIDVACFRTTATGTSVSNFRLGSNLPAFPGESVFGDILNGCPSGEAVIGIQGRSGSYVDSIGLICGVFTTAAPTNPEQRPEACRALTNDPVPDDWSEMLRAHNDLRVHHCVAPLTWSNELAQAAQAYAEKCVLNMHGSSGENLADAWTEMNGKPVLPAVPDKQAFQQTWACEVNNYDFANPTFKSGFTANCKDVNGHFTQVVWKDTCQLGCGRATCEMRDDQGVVHMGTHWVCRYKPPGNVNANDKKVLKQQVLPPLCGQ